MYSYVSELNVGSLVVFKKLLQAYVIARAVGAMGVVGVVGVVGSMGAIKPLFCEFT